MHILSDINESIDILWMQDIRCTNRIVEDIKRGVIVYEQAVTES